MAVAKIFNDDDEEIGEVELDMWLSGNESPASITNKIQTLITDNEEDEDKEEDS